MKRNGKTIITTVSMILSIFFLSGCADMGLGLGSGSDAEMAAPPPPAESQPYYAANKFDDLLIPNELTWNRDKSMVINTESFAGGVLNYKGKVDINSLTEFFEVTMQKNGWKMAGSVKYKNVLLAFVKPNKTCTITMSDDEFGMKTDVFIYITQDISAHANGSLLAPMPMGSGM